MIHLAYLRNLWITSLRSFASLRETYLVTILTALTKKLDRMNKDEQDLGARVSNSLHVNLVNPVLLHAYCPLLSDL